MKKEFKKPELRRISLNLSENIARSDPPGYTGIFKLNWENEGACPVWTSGVMYHNITEANFPSTYPCLVISSASAARKLGLRG